MSSVGEVQHWILFGPRSATSQAESHSRKLCWVPTGVRNSRNLTEQSCSKCQFHPKGRPQPGLPQRFSGRGLHIRSPYPAKELRLTFAKANASAVMFTRRVSQRDDFRVFTIALGTTRHFTHGDLLLRNCHLPMITAASSSFTLSEDGGYSSLNPSQSIFNSSKCLARLSLRITRSNSADV